MYQVKYSHAKGGWMVLYRENQDTKPIPIDGPFMTEPMAAARRKELIKEGKPS